MKSLNSQLDVFDQLIDELAKSYSIEQLADYVYVINGSNRDPSKKRWVKQSFSALVHGNEVGGIAVINEVLRQLVTGVVVPSFPIGMALGNIEAAHENERFLEVDMNRTFGVKVRGNLEAHRAAELEPLLDISEFYIDFHQTIQPSSTPFFIFPFNRNAYEFACDIGADVPIITHWGKPFSRDGQCSDEYVISGGGTGITLELGQMGFNMHHTFFGAYISMQALYRHNKRLRQEPVENKLLLYQSPQVFTFDYIHSLEGESVNDHLAPGFQNFQAVEADEVLGISKDGPLRSPVEGWIIFPKYPDSQGQINASELFRVMRRADESELPEA